MEHPYTERKQAADYRDLKAQLYSFLNHSTGEEKYLMRDILDEWSGVRDPASKCVALAEACGRVLDLRVGKNYVCVEPNQVSLVESFLRFEAGLEPPDVQSS